MMYFISSLYLLVPSAITPGDLQSCSVIGGTAGGAADGQNLALQFAALLVGTRPQGYHSAAQGSKA